MTRQIQCNYFWPLGKAWIAQYIKGCATCQQNKNLTHITKTSCTLQKPHAHYKNPTLQNHSAGKCTPIHTDSNGSNHRTTEIMRIQSLWKQVYLLTQKCT